jgi:two-component system response regulator
MTHPEDYVLMVEDNADDVTLTLLSFKRNNFDYKIVVVRDGKEALDFLFGADQQKQWVTGQWPALILLDLNLPKVSGFEVLKRLRNDPQLSQVPVVILTSSNLDNDKIEAHRLGANLYIRKPINYDDFNNVANQIKIFLPAHIPSV